MKGGEVMKIIKRASKALNYASSNGWLLEYRLDGGAWENIMFGVDLAQGEDRTEYYTPPIES